MVCILCGAYSAWCAFCVVHILRGVYSVWCVFCVVCILCGAYSAIVGQIQSVDGYSIQVNTLLYCPPTYGYLHCCTFVSCTFTSSNVARFLLVSFSGESRIVGTVIGDRDWEP